MKNKTKIIIGLIFALYVLGVVIYAGVMIGRNDTAAQSRQAPATPPAGEDAIWMDPEGSPFAEKSGPAPKETQAEPPELPAATRESPRQAGAQGIPELDFDGFTLPSPPATSAPGAGDTPVAARTPPAARERRPLEGELAPLPQRPAAPAAIPQQEFGEKPPEATAEPGPLPSAPSPVSGETVRPPPERSARAQTGHTAKAQVEHPAALPLSPTPTEAAAPAGPKGTCIFDIKAFEFSGDNNYGYHVDCYVYQIKLESVEAPRYVDTKEFGSGCNNYEIATFKDVPVPWARTYLFLYTIKYKACYGNSVERYFTKSRNVKTYARDQGKWITEMDILRTWEIPAP